MIPFLTISWIERDSLISPNAIYMIVSLSPLPTGSMPEEPPQHSEKKQITHPWSRDSIRSSISMFAGLSNRPLGPARCDELILTMTMGIDAGGWLRVGSFLESMKHLHDVMSSHL